MSLTSCHLFVGCLSLAGYETLFSFFPCHYEEPSRPSGPPQLGSNSESVLMILSHSCVYHTVCLCSNGRLTEITANYSGGWHEQGSGYGILPGNTKMQRRTGVAPSYRVTNVFSLPSKTLETNTECPRQSKVYQGHALDAWGRGATVAPSFLRDGSSR